jgi:hypothetical protein
MTVVPGGTVPRMVSATQVDVADARSSAALADVDVAEAHKRYRRAIERTSSS